MRKRPRRRSAGWPEGNYAEHAIDCGRTFSGVIPSRGQAANAVGDASFAAAPPKQPRWSNKVTLLQTSSEEPCDPPARFPATRPSEVIAARDRAVTALLAERAGQPAWAGELSSSALATATAVTAMEIMATADPVRGEQLRVRIVRGCGWLASHQNSDGGWGDTPESLSNISTTILAWSALSFCSRGTDGAEAAVTRAGDWLATAAGSLKPPALVSAIERRYGDDRTFAIPILTMCALCGKLGTGSGAWEHVRQLPFEVAILPQYIFGALQLPVVSYALPALIAIGQVRHWHRPSRNVFARCLRDRVKLTTLGVLERMQPHNGGFLEATPLTSFVTMSLGAMQLGSHRVATRGLLFIEASQRLDGSWPIDTNLATWVTTLSLQSLATEADDAALDKPEYTAAVAWLLQQQFRIVHPYTRAAPGGWGWTDLPGAVPDADDTAGAVLTIARSGRHAEEVTAGIRWLLDLQNRDGGMPTFCRGWGKLPFDRSSPDITAHAVRAWLAGRSMVDERIRRRIDRAVTRALTYLMRAQRADGAWVPLWFGHERDARGENPVYGTARVLLALCDAKVMQYREPLARATEWLVAKQGPDGGWSGADGARSSVEETGLAIEALAAARATTMMDGPRLRDALEGGGAWLVRAINNELWRRPSPIGLYFAVLWYSERLYPLIFATGALSRLAAELPALEHSEATPVASRTPDPNPSIS